MLRNTILVMLGLCIVAACYGQQYIGMGLKLYPHYGNRRIVVYDNTMQSFVDSLEATERSRPSYTAGFELSRRGEKVSVSMEVGYSQTGFRSVRQSIPFDDPLSIKYTEESYSFRAHQIDMPLMMRFYQKLSEKDEFFFTLGTALSFSIANQDVYTRYNEEESERAIVKSPQSFKLVNYAMETGMGWEHRIGKETVMSVAPSFRLWLGGLYKELQDLPFNRNLYQVGIRFGVRLDREIVYIE